jgi:hypothetical protein
LSHRFDRPDRYVEPSRFDTMPSLLKDEIAVAEDESGKLGHAARAKCSAATGLYFCRHFLVGSTTGPRQSAAMSGARNVSIDALAKGKG